jgi:hypothetical protein
MKEKTKGNLMAIALFLIAAVAATLMYFRV